MKKLLVLWVALAAMCFTGCSKDDDDDDNGEGGITMVTEAKEVYFEVFSLKEGETIIIDWGDGAIEELITKYHEDADEEDDFAGYICEIRHSYADDNFHTITVKGNIQGLWCSDDQLTMLDISKCTTLTELDCADNNLTTLNVEKCTKLTCLICRFNRLTTLDVSKNTALIQLDCAYNQLTALDVSKNTALVWFWCSDNQLTMLDISKCTKLADEFHCSDNKFSSSVLNQIFKDLPTTGGYISISGNPGSKICDKSIAENKGWMFTHR